MLKDQTWDLALESLTLYPLGQLSGYRTNRSKKEKEKKQEKKKERKRKTEDKLKKKTRNMH